MSRPVAVLLVLTALAVALAAAWWTNSAADADVTPAADPAQRVERTAPPPLASEIPLANDAARNEVALEATRIVAVRSAAGLRLAEVDVSVAGGVKTRLPLVDGRVDLARYGRDVVDVAAPGHRPAHAAADAADVVLEPGATLTLVAPRLEQITRRAYLELGVDILTERMKEVVTFGFTDADHFVIATNPDEAAAIHPRTLVDQLALDLTSGLELRVQWAPSDGDRHLHVVSFPPGSELAEPVALRVLPRGAAAPAGPADVEVRVFVFHPGPDRNVVAQETVSWGRVFLLRPNVDLKRHFDSIPDAIDFEPIPPGLHYRVMLLDSVSGTFGRAFFDHTGAPVDLPLLHGWTVTGRIAADDRPETTVLDRVSVTGWFAVARPDDGAKPIDNVSWRFERVPAALSSAREFRLVVPRTVPISSDFSFPPPRTLQLDIEGRGFQPTHVIAELPDAEHVDLGAIRLEPKSPALVLMQSHALHDLGVVWNDVYFDSDGTTGYLNVIDDVALPGGDLEVFLKYRECAFDFASRFPESIVVRLNDSAARAFTRVARNQYRPVPQRDFEVRVELAAEDLMTSFDYGWRWRGVTVACGGDNVIEGKPFAVTLTCGAPTEDAVFWCQRSNPLSSDLSDTRELTAPLIGAAISVRDS